MISTALLTFWSRAATITTGSPEVVARRLALMNSPSGWTIAGAIEIQSMLVEKAEATLETSVAILRNVRPVSFGEWFSPANGFLSTANELMRPLSERVDANVLRLRAMKSDQH